MDDDIFEVFTDVDELGPDAIVYEMATGESGMRSAWAPLKDNENGRISTLAEVFLEWYLFDSSKKKDVETFLGDEEIQDVFTEADFMDLMCDMAWLDDDLLQFVSLKLPFVIKLERLEILNAVVKKQNPEARLIKKTGIEDKITLLGKAKAQQIKEKNNRKARLRYHKNRPAELERSKRYRETHPEHGHEYYLQNMDHILSRSHEYYLKHQDEIKIKRGVYYQKNKPEILEKQKQRYKEHKPKILESRSLYWLKLKRLSKSAQRICAAYVFLISLKKTNRGEYLKLYTQQQKPLTSMLRTCAALQNMDMNMCPLCNSECEISLEQCCNQNVLNLPGAIDSLRKIVKKLIKNRRRRESYALNKESCTQRKESKEKKAARAKKWNKKNKARKRVTNSVWYVNNKPAISERMKLYYQEHKEGLTARHRLYQETHREEMKAANKKYRERMKQTAESAQKVCAAYVFLMNLKEHNRKEYLKLYTRKQNPLTGMLKTCAALQSMDMTLCPFCNPASKQTIDTCCNQKVLSVPDAINEIQIIADNLMQNRVQNGK